MTLLRQHVIDPVICIRCNTCEETCPSNAITHDDNNYVVDPEICQQEMNQHCLGPCPTGAIDSWVNTARFFTPEEQFEWTELPDPAADSDETSDDPADEPSDVAAIRRIATEGEGGIAAPPYSAAHASLHLYSAQRPATAKVTGHYRLTSDDASCEIRHIVLDLGNQFFPVLEGQSIGVTPPGVDANGFPHHIRLYSVASPRDGERPGHNNLALTVKRVVADRDGASFKGVASNFLCDLNPGDEIPIVGPFGTTFLMPNHREARIIMICTGTGAAPFRAMTERVRRTRPNAPGKLLLFFGARTPTELPYHGPLMKLPPDLIDVELAFSRVSGQPRQYVQDRLRARGQTVGEWLRDEETYIYICGRKDMEPGCATALEEISRGIGRDWEEIRQTMRENGRYHVETY